VQKKISRLLGTEVALHTRNYLHLGAINMSFHKSSKHIFCLTLMANFALNSYADSGKKHAMSESPGTSNTVGEGSALAEELSESSTNLPMKALGFGTSLALSTAAFVSRRFTENAKWPIEEKYKLLNEAVAAGKEFDELIEKFDLSQTTMNVSSEAVTKSYRIQKRLLAVLNQVESLGKGMSPASVLQIESLKGQIKGASVFLSRIENFQVTALYDRNVPLTESIRNEIASFKGGKHTYGQMRPISASAVQVSSMDQRILDHLKTRVKILNWTAAAGILGMSLSAAGIKQELDKKISATSY